MRVRVEYYEKKVDFLKFKYEDSTNGGKAAKAAGAKCVWYHNPDSGDQNIPYAELEIGEWNAENVNKLIQIMKEN